MNAREVRRTMSGGERNEEETKETEGQATSDGEGTARRKKGEEEKTKDMTEYTQG